MQSRVYESAGRPTVCLCVCPIIWPAHADAAGLLLWVRLAGDRQRRPPAISDSGAAARQQIAQSRRPRDIDRLLHGRRSAANASSVALSADVGCSTRKSCLSELQSSEFVADTDQHLSRKVGYADDKKLRYRPGTARCVVSVEVLPFATQQCINYLYDKS